VYAATDSQTDQACALKVQRKLEAGVQAANERDILLLSADSESTACQLIVQLHASFEDDSFFYMVLELCDGGSLRWHLDERGEPFGEPAGLALIVALAGALAHLHARGILHRDVKLDNLVLDCAGGVKLIDMGISWACPVIARDMGRSAGAEHGQGLAGAAGAMQCLETSGTRSGMAPEMFLAALGAPHSAPADVFMGGCCAYELLHMKKPFSQAALGRALRMPPGNGNDTGAFPGTGALAALAAPAVTPAVTPAAAIAPVPVLAPLSGVADPLPRGSSSERVLPTLVPTMPTPLMAVADTLSLNWKAVYAPPRGIATTRPSRLSDGCRKLLRQLLATHPDARPTAAAVLAHPECSRAVASAASPAANADADAGDEAPGEFVLCVMEGQTCKLREHQERAGALERTRGGMVPFSTS
jgi:serine/threonine protein kinase